MISTASAAQDSRTSSNISTGAGRSEGQQRTWSSTSMARNPPTSTAPAAHSGSAAAPCSAQTVFPLNMPSFCSRWELHLLMRAACAGGQLWCAKALTLAICVDGHAASTTGCMPAGSQTACSASKCPLAARDGAQCRPAVHLVKEKRDKVVALFFAPADSRTACSASKPSGSTTASAVPTSSPAPSALTAPSWLSVTVSIPAQLYRSHNTPCPSCFSCVTAHY